MLCTGGLTYLVVVLFSETNTEQTEQITIGCLDIAMSVNHGPPLFDHGTHVVPGKIHAVKVSWTVFTLKIPINYLEISKCHFVLLYISKAHFKHTTLGAIRCNFGFLSPCEQCFSNVSDIEHSRSFHIPTFLQKRSLPS